MRKTKFFLAQFLIEVDVSDKPDFDESRATVYLQSALHLQVKDKSHDLKVYPLSAKPAPLQDETIEVYKYRDFDIEICQNADTLGTDQPTYFTVVSNPQAKTYSGSLVGGHYGSIEEAKSVGEQHVDKRIVQIEKRNKGKTATTPIKQPLKLVE
jgi:hypothetical protein